MDASKHSTLALVALQRPHCAVPSHQRGRARGVSRHARALQAKDVGYAPNRETVSHPADAVDTCRQRDLAKLSGCDANMDTHPTAEEVLPSKTDCVGQGVAVLKEKSLLRIHSTRLGHGY